MEPMHFDNFESLWEGSNKPASFTPDKPPNGTYLFTVRSAAYYKDAEDPAKSKLWISLETESGASITRNCYLGNPDKIEVNKSWIDCMCDAPPLGKFEDYEWSGCEGKTIVAEVRRFTPADREEEVAYVCNPVRPGPAEGPAEEAVVRRPKATRTAKIDRETQANKADVPF